MADPAAANSVTYDYLFKLLLIGDSGVGKSSLLLRFSDDQYKGDNISTVGVDFKIRTLLLDGKMTKLQIWDTAGAERFRTITTSYFRGADGVLVVYDVTNLESFQNVDDWLHTLQQHCRDGVTTMLIGAKCDVPQEERKVAVKDGMEKAATGSMLFMETSAKDNINVESAFTTLSAALRDQRSQRRLPDTMPGQSPPLAGAGLPPSGQILLSPPVEADGGQLGGEKKKCDC